MNPVLSRMPLRPVAAVAIIALTLFASPSEAETNRVKFPTNLELLKHYATVKRGEVTEHILTSQEAIDATRAGKPVPNGTHFVLVDYRDEKVFRYFVMEKGADFGAQYEPSRRTGDWQFQAFKPDKTVNLSETTSRCQSCHQGAAGNQHLFTFNDLKRAN